MKYDVLNMAFIRHPGVNSTYEINTKKDAACHRIRSAGNLGTDHHYSDVLDAGWVCSGYNDVGFV